MKAKSVFCGLTAMLFMLLGIALTSCEADDADVPLANEEGSAPEETEPMQNLAQVGEGTDFMILNGDIKIMIPAENTGVTSANVRLYIEDTGETRQWYRHAYRLLDLVQFSRYHEFIQREAALRIIFSTQNAVSDFRFFDVMWNEAFSREGADETERRYTVLNTLYILNELTPEIPFVVQGPWFGSIFPHQGFSFVDEDGTTRYFVFGRSGMTGLIYVGEF